MKTFGRILLVPLVVTAGVAALYAGLGLYRGIAFADAEVISRSAQTFGTNWFLVAVGLLMFRRLGGRGGRKKRPLLGKRSLRLSKVGQAPSIGLF